MSSVATGIAAGAAAQGAANSARIAAEHRARCRTDIADFRPEGASVERMKSYAECVQYMHPYPIHPESVPFVKAGIVALLLAMVAGFWFGKKKGVLGNGFEAGWGDAIVLAFVFPFALAVATGVVWLIVAGIMYVVSA